VAAGKKRTKPNHKKPPLKQEEKITFFSVCKSFLEPLPCFSSTENSSDSKFFKVIGYRILLANQYKVFHASYLNNP
jgi:hypothetical protein